MFTALKTFGRYLQLMGRTFARPERMNMFFRQYVSEISKLGINSIPAVIFPDGSRYTGLMSVEAIEENLANSAAKK